MHIFIKKHGKDQVKDVGLNVEGGEENAHTVEKTAFAVENIQIQGLKNIMVIAQNERFAMPEQ